MNDDELTQEELEEYFKNLNKEDFIQSTQNSEELKAINEWEEKQNNSTEIYKIKARVANLARADGGALTPVGDMLCNLFVHVLKELYDFADTIHDEKMKIKLISLIQKHENMPSKLINAANIKKKT